MEIKDWKLLSHDDHIIKGLRYKSEKGQPKAVILICHGMAEHQGRYETFASYLGQQGFVVYTYNHRGHGADLMIEDLGHFHNENGWQKVVEDCIRVLEFIQREEGLPLYLFGHSMGSLIARDVIQAYDQIEGLILSGTSYGTLFQNTLGLNYARILRMLFGNKTKSSVLNKLVFMGFNKKVEEKRTGFDWLSSDRIEVDLYMLDPYCGFNCTNAFYVDLLTGLRKTSLKKCINKTRKDLSILLISGEDDPVGMYGKGVRKFHSRLEALGFENVQLKLYRDRRHELLKEINKEEVYQDILTWFTPSL